MAMQKRDALLSVKASPVEKWMIIQAAKRYGMTYSEFVRTVAVSTARQIGIEEPSVEEIPPVTKKRQARSKDASRPKVVPA